MLFSNPVSYTHLEQVILYVQEAQSQGKTQQEMLVELMKKGVTKEQIQRIQSKYSGKSDGSSEENANFMGEANSRLRTQKTYENKNKNISQNESGLDKMCIRDSSRVLYQNDRNSSQVHFGRR